MWLLHMRSEGPCLNDIYCSPSGGYESLWADNVFSFGATKIWGS